MSWVILIIAGILEIFWAIGLKYTNGFRNLAPSMLVIGAISTSIFFLAVAAKQIPIGIAYSIWVGIGALGTVITGAILFQESISIMKGIFLFLLFVAILGIKLSK